MLSSKTVTSKTVTSNLTSKTVTSTVKRGQTGGQTGSPVGGGVGGGGPLLMMIGDAMTLFDPIWPRFTVDVTVFEVKFDVTVTMVSI